MKCGYWCLARQVAVITQGGHALMCIALNLDMIKMSELHKHFIYVL